MNRTLASRYGPELDGIVVCSRLARNLFLEGLITPAHLAKAIEEKLGEDTVLVIPDVNVAGYVLYLEVETEPDDLLLFPFAINRQGDQI